MLLSHEVGMQKFSYLILVNVSFIVANYDNPLKYLIPIQIIIALILFFDQVIALILSKPGCNFLYINIILCY